MKRDTATRPAPEAARSRRAVSTYLLITFAVAVVTLVAFAAVAAWATANGGSDMPGWPLWQGVDPRPR